MSFKKYLWKCRLLVLNTPNYSHPEYKRSKDLYQKDIKGCHKRYIKLVTKLDKCFFIFEFASQIVVIRSLLKGLGLIEIKKHFAFGSFSSTWLENNKNSFNNSSLSIP